MMKGEQMKRVNISALHEKKNIVLVWNDKLDRLEFWNNKKMLGFTEHFYDADGNFFCDDEGGLIDY